MIKKIFKKQGRSIKNIEIANLNPPSDTATNKPVEKKPFEDHWKLADKLEKPYKFLITSCGQSGSVWLASSLNKHPEIICSAGLDHILSGLWYDYNSSEIDQIVDAIKSPDDIKFGISGHMASYLSKRKIESEKNNDQWDPKKFKTRNLLENPSCLFEEIKTSGLQKVHNISALGNVHGFTASNFSGTIKVNPNAFGTAVENIAAIDLIRNPVTRLDSQINYCEHLYNSENNVKNTVDEIVNSKLKDFEKIVKEWKLDFNSPRVRVFFWTEVVLTHSKGWSEDIYKNTNLPKVLFERLKSDPNYFAWLISFITRGKVIADKEFLDTILSDKNLDAGRMSAPVNRKNRSSAKDCYDSWSDWEKSVFKKHVEDFNLQEIYAPYGYDLSFAVK